MKKITIAAAFALLTLPAWAQEHGRPELATTEPPMLGLHWARGAEPEAKLQHAPPFGGGGSSPNITYHGGPVMNSGTLVEAIFWGPKWSISTFAGDKVAGINTFYTNVGGTRYAGTNAEYTDGSGRFVSTAVTNGSNHFDGSLTPRRAPNTSTVLGKVCAAIGNAAVANGYYPVYTDIRRGSAGYCAWHSWGSCPANGVNVPVQFGFFFDLDGDAGCDPQDNADRNPKPSQGLAALNNVGGHELSEVMTDPRGNAWYDGQGYENSDKCAWDFSGSLITIGGTQWKIQGNWSNAAYNTGTGFANEKGQKGCIDGH